MNNEKLKLRTSKINTFLHCRRQYNFEYNEGLVPKIKAYPLKVGDVTHRLLDLLYTKKLTIERIQALPEWISELFPNDSEYETGEVVTEASRLMAGYITKWKDDKIELIGSEVMIETELEDCILYSKVDKIVKWNNELWRMEHKTTSRMDGAYLSGLRGGLQGAIYEYSITKLFPEETLKGSIYDILVKTKVPQYSRQPVMTNIKVRERMLETVHAIARELNNNCELYPSCQCFYYEHECPYRILCEHDSKEAREAFFEKREDPFDNQH